MAPNGDFVVTWDNDDLSGSHGINETVYARAFFADGEPKSPVMTVATNKPPTTLYVAKPRVAIASDGSFVVAWNIWHDTSPNQVAFRRFAADGTAKDANPVLADASESPIGFSQDGVDVAAFDDGGFVLVWTHYVYGTPGSAIELRTFQADGTPLGAATPISGYTADDAHVSASHVTGKPAQFVVTFEEPGSSTNQLLAQTYSESGHGGVEINITAFKGTDNDSTVAMNGNGVFAVAWQHEFSQTSSTVYAQRFDFSGNPLDSVPIVATQQPFDPFASEDPRPAVALADDNSLAVTLDDPVASRPVDMLFDPSGQVIGSSNVLDGYDNSYVAGAYAGYTAMAMNGSGRFVVSWQQDPNANFINQVEVRRFHADLRPIARDDTYVLSDSASSTVSIANGVFVNDSDPWGNSSQLFVSDVSKPAYGTLLTGDAGSNTGTGTYTKGPNFQDIDRFTYQLGDLDSNGPGNTATVTLLSYHASLVDKLYHQVLHRSAEDSGLIYWTAQLDAGQPLDVVATGIFNSTERLDPLVTQFYQQYLLRGTDPGGLAYWVHDWQTKGDPRDVVENILSSPEFFDDAGDTKVGYVSLLYQRVLQRSPEATGLNYWVSLMSNPPTNPPQSRFDIASQFYDTHEKHVDLVDFLFSEYFNGISPLPSIDPYVADLDFPSNQTETQVEKAILDSPQYQSAPPQPAAGSVGRALYDH